MTASVAGANLGKWPSESLGYAAARRARWAHTREARGAHGAGCTSVQCPSSHGADFVVLPSDDGAHRCGAGSKLSTSRGRGKPGRSPVRCSQCAHDRIEGIVHFGLLEAV